MITEQFRAEMEEARKESEENLRLGIVSLGGLFGPPYSLSRAYARAGRTLFTVFENSRDLGEMAPTILFLIRHAVELAFKSLLWAYDDVQLSQAKLDQHDGKPNTANPLPNSARKRLDREHSLTKLSGWVTQWLPEYVAPNWEEFVVNINKHERDCPERWRYYTVHIKDEAGVKRMVPSFDKKTLIPLRDLLDQLDIFLKQANEISEPADTDETMSLSALDELSSIGQHLDQLLYSRGLL